jgi:hypothetical protein
VERHLKDGRKSLEEKMFRVIFTYDEIHRKWEAKVEGATNKVEARQGFSAVVVSCQELDPMLLIHTQVSDDYKITPAVMP